jgi:outer membrane protein assembly factor BamC
LTVSTSFLSSSFMVKITPSLSALTLAACMVLAGCSTVEEFLSGDKVDYKGQSVKTAPLEVPPDLTQLQRDGRYASQSSGTVSASTFQTAPLPGAAAAAAAGVVATTALGEMKVLREGNQRWLVVPMSADALWPQLRSFWQERGFSLITDNPEVGVMETDWAENRAKIPQDGIRRAIGRLLERFYDSGERDRFKTRIERNGSGGTEVYITHRGMEEVFVDAQKTETTWRARPSDTQLESEFLQRLMVKLGGKEEQVKQAVATPLTPTATPKAQVLSGQTALRMDEPFDRAWRRVGLALDRNGFTVEDRNRTDGIYFVRYVDPKTAGQDGPGFFARLFGADNSAAAPARYRVLVKGEAAQTLVSVQDGQGGAVSKDIGERIVALLAEDLK